MPSLSYIRQNYPEFNDYSDADVINVAREFDIDVTSDPEPVKSSEPRNFLTDTGSAVISGALRVPGMATGLLDIPFGYAGLDRPISRGWEAIGDRIGVSPGKLADDIDQNALSSELLQSRQAVDDAWRDGNALDIAQAYVENPRTIADTVTRSVPAMLAGGLLGRAVVGAGAVGGAVGEGMLSAGGAMDSIDDSVAPEDRSTAALGTGLAVGALSGIGGKVADKLGVADIDTLATGGATSSQVARPLYQRVPMAAVQEGLVEEAPQSAIEQGFQNLAEDKPFTEGMARQAIEGGLAGGVMGAGAGFKRPELNTAPPSMLDLLNEARLQQGIDVDTTTLDDTQSSSDAYTRAQQRLSNISESILNSDSIESALDAFNTSVATDILVAPEIEIPSTLQETLNNEQIENAVLSEETRQGQEGLLNDVGALDTIESAPALNSDYENTLQNEQTQQSTNGQVDGLQTQPEGTQAIDQATQQQDITQEINAQQPSDTIRLGVDTIGNTTNTADSLPTTGNNGLEAAGESIAGNSRGPEPSINATGSPIPGQESQSQVETASAQSAQAKLPDILNQEQPIAVNPLSQTTESNISKTQDKSESLNERLDLKNTRLTPIDNIYVDQYADDLRDMANKAGWAEVGGKLLRDYNGVAVGRTRWIPNADWYKEVENRLGAQQTIDAVEKAINKKPMAAKEKRAVESMINYLHYTIEENLNAQQSAHAEKITQLYDLASKVDENFNTNFYQDIIKDDNLNDEVINNWVEDLNDYYERYSNSNASSAPSGTEKTGAEDARTAENTLDEKLEASFLQQTNFDDPNAEVKFSQGNASSVAFENIPPLFLDSLKIAVNDGQGQKVDLKFTAVYQHVKEQIQAYTDFINCVRG